MSSWRLSRRSWTRPGQPPLARPRSGNARSGAGPGGWAAHGHHAAAGRAGPSGCWWRSWRMSPTWCSPMSPEPAIHHPIVRRTIGGIERSAKNSCHRESRWAHQPVSLCWSCCCWSRGSRPGRGSRSCWSSDPIELAVGVEPSGPDDRGARVGTRTRDPRGPGSRPWWGSPTSPRPWWTCTTSTTTTIVVEHHPGGPARRHRVEAGSRVGASEIGGWVPVRSSNCSEARAAGGIRSMGRVTLQMTLTAR